MKIRKQIAVFIFALLVSGCASMRESGWYDHDTQYASWDHARFSMWGCKNPTAKDAVTGKQQGWWGLPVKVPAEGKR